MARPRCLGKAYGFRPMSSVKRMGSTPAPRMEAAAGSRRGLACRATTINRGQIRQGLCSGKRPLAKAGGDDARPATARAIATEPDGAHGRDLKQRAPWRQLGLTRASAIVRRGNRFRNHEPPARHLAYSQHRPPTPIALRARPATTKSMFRSNPRRIRAAGTAPMPQRPP